MNFQEQQNENGIIVRNKTRLAAYGYSQIKGIDYEQTFTLVARLEAIRIFLVIACSLRRKLYQMYVLPFWIKSLGKKYT